MIDSLCWTCRRTAVTCAWLALGRQYNGMECEEKQCSGGGNRPDYTVTKVLKCPKHKPIPVQLLRNGEVVQEFTGAKECIGKLGKRSVGMVERECDRNCQSSVRRGYTMCWKKGAY